MTKRWPMPTMLPTEMSRKLGRPLRARSTWISATSAATMTAPIRANSFLSSRYVKIDTTSSACRRAAARVRATSANRGSRPRRARRRAADRARPPSGTFVRMPSSPARPAINAPPPVSMMPLSSKSPATSGGRRFEHRADRRGRCARSPRASLRRPALHRPRAPRGAAARRSLPPTATGARPGARPA